MCHTKIYFQVLNLLLGQDIRPTLQMSVVTNIPKISDFFLIICEINMNI